MEQLGAHRRTILPVAPPANAAVVVEVAVDSVAGALAAAAAGAHRLELCQGLELGGLTPSLGLVTAVKAAVKVPVFSMLRPRAGDFLYDGAEFAAMLRDVEHLRAAGADGLVSGMLTQDGGLDRARLRDLRSAAARLPLTCHRAFDLAADGARAIDALIELGFARVLTSGHCSNAIDGAAAIRDCVARAGDRLVVMAGAGVCSTNVRELLAATGVREVHLSATTWRPSAMSFRRAGVPMGSSRAPDEYSHRATDGAMVARVVAAVRNG